MGSIYIRYPDGQMTQRTEEEARRLWSEGLMPNGTIYWKEGMTDWQPVSEWLGERPVVASEAGTRSNKHGTCAYHFQVDPNRPDKAASTAALDWGGGRVHCSGG